MALRLALESASSRGFTGLRILVVTPTPSHPQDYGNRRRIYRICKTLQEQGASITFVHYPAEQEWRDTPPSDARRAMQQAWDEYYEVTPTRPLHASSIGKDHLIDEWWDPGIGEFLKNLQRARTFDIVIVNYVWLSKTFQCLPDRTFRILDTHDRFADRRKLLARVGIAPEFFHTTIDEEATALARADLIWAIQEGEAEEFRMETRNPIVVIPHWDPLTKLEPPREDASGMLRVGIVAARNSLNQNNIVAFVGAAVAKARRTMAPIQFIIAGSIGELLPRWSFPEVKVLGPVADVAVFYAGVDLVAIPMIESSGIKIRTGEALSFGLPVVSTAHGFEGYAITHAMHGARDFVELADNIIEISFDRSILSDLRIASLRSHAVSRQEFETGLAMTAKLRSATERRFLVLADAAAVETGSLAAAALDSLCDALGHRGPVAVLIAAGHTTPSRVSDASLRFERLLVAAETLPSKARKAAGFGAATVGSLSELVADWRPTVTFVDCIGPALDRLALGESIILRAALTGGEMELTVNSVKPGQVGVWLGEERDLVTASAIAALSTPPWRLPLFSRARFREHVGRRQRPTPANSVAILVRRVGDFEQAIADFVARVGLKPVLYALDGATSGQETVPIHSPADLIFSTDWPDRWPGLFVDVSGAAVGFQAVREAADRLATPRISLDWRWRRRSLQSAGPTVFGLGGLALAILEHSRAESRPVARADDDTSWAVLATYLTDLLPCDSATLESGPVATGA